MGLIFETISNSITSLRNHFTVRAFLFLFFGAALLIANLILFVFSLLYAFSHYNFLQVMFLLFWASIGFLVSCFLIFYYSVYTAANTSDSHRQKGIGTSILSQAFAYRGKGRTKLIVIAVLIYAVIWLVGIGVTGYYFIDKAKYNDYINASATIVSLISTGDEGYSCKYKYTVDGVDYTVEGTLESSGESLPMVGDIVTIKYNPNNPAEVYLANEKIFFLAFGCFFLFVGLLLIMFELSNKGIISIKLFLAFVLLGLTAIVVMFTLTNGYPAGIVQYFARYLWFHFIMAFTNMGFLMLFEGIVDFKLPKRTSRR